jgi:uncharacterized protein YdcH (DUF465 family)
MTIGSVIVTITTIATYKIFEQVYVKYFRQDTIEDFSDIRRCLSDYQRLREDYNNVISDFKINNDRFTRLEDNHKKLHNAFLKQIEENEKLKSENRKLKVRIIKLETILTRTFGDIWQHLDDDSVDWQKLNDIINTFIIKSKLIHTEVK